MIVRVLAQNAQYRQGPRPGRPVWENARSGRAMERMTIDVVTREPAPPAARGRALRALALVAGALVPLRPLGPRPAGVRGLGGGRRSPALLRPPPPARPRLELRAGRDPGLAGVARHPGPAPPERSGTGPAGGRALLPAVGPGRRARLLRRRRLGDRVGLPARPARPASATAGPARPAASTCSWCARPDARWRWSARARTTSRRPPARSSRRSRALPPRAASPVDRPRSSC